MILLALILIVIPLMRIGIANAEGRRDIMRNASDFYIPGKYTDENGITIPYQLHLPEQMEENETYPLILFMHGAGFVGSDNLQLVNGAEITICNNILAKGPECIILVPQTPFQSVFCHAG